MTLTATYIACHVVVVLLWIVGQWVWSWFTKGGES